MKIRCRLKHFLLKKTLISKRQIICKNNQITSREDQKLNSYPKDKLLVKTSREDQKLNSEPKFHLPRSSNG